MAGASETYHEPLDQLSSQTKDMHRALVSLQEELEAVDWYRQRADACADEELKDILLHNMREEVEHACLVLEWLRRNSADFDKQMKIYLFKDKPIVEAEGEEADISETSANYRNRSLYKFTIGDLKEKSKP